MKHRVSIAPPIELSHAARHLSAALEDWQAGKMEMALVHLREGITDAVWSLHAASVDEPWMAGWRAARDWPEDE